MSKYGIRRLQEKREGGFTECPEGGVSVCVHVCVRAGTSAERSRLSAVFSPGNACCRALHSREKFCAIQEDGGR